MRNRADKLIDRTKNVKKKATRATAAKVPNRVF